MAWGEFASFSWKGEEGDPRLLVKTSWRIHFLTNKNNSTASSSPTPAPAGTPSLFLEGALPQSLPEPHQRRVLPLSRSSCTPAGSMGSGGRDGGRKGALLFYSPAERRRYLGAGAHEDLWLCHTPPGRASLCYPGTLKLLSAQASLR